jgi:hypothetical protein
MTTPTDRTVLKKRKARARAPFIVIGALDENARMLIRDPHSQGIGERISELLDELSRSLGRKTGDEEGEA